jgi:predicted GH43/DUF377 family glycosyl hydrolase
MKYGILSRPKYIITDEVVHSSILKVTTKLSSLFVMVATPYPRTYYIRLMFRPPFIVCRKDLDGRYENPSILFSSDGIYWTEKTQNPIFPPPRNAKRSSGPHNYDPCLVWNPKKEKAFLFFNNWGDGFRNVRLLVSKDFNNWTDIGPTDVEIVDGNNIRVSPSVTYESEENKFYMLFVHADLYSNEKPFLELLHSVDGLHWVKNAELDLSVNINGSKFYPWHIVFRKVGDEYWMLSSMNYGNLSRPPMYLFFSRSKDLINWEVYNKPVLKPSNNGFDDKMIYHSDLLVDKDDVYLWFSGVSKANRYGIGLVKGKLSNGANNDIQSSNVVRIDHI